MRIGVGIDDRLGLSLSEQRSVVQESARLGYESLWTPANVAARSTLFVCVQWWQASTEVVAGGLAVGISVIPFPAWTVTTLAAQAATVSDITGGKLSLGIGLGGYPAPGFRHRLGLPDVPVLPYTREFVTVLRALLRGETVDYDGEAI